MSHERGGIRPAGLDAVLSWQALSDLMGCRGSPREPFYRGILNDLARCLSVSKVVKEALLYGCFVTKGDTGSYKRVLKEPVMLFSVLVIRATRFCALVKCFCDPQSTTLICVVVFTVASQTVFEGKSVKV